MFFLLFHIFFHILFRYFSVNSFSTFLRTKAVDCSDQNHLLAFWKLMKLVHPSWNILSSTFWDCRLTLQSDIKLRKFNAVVCHKMRKSKTFQSPAQHSPTDSSSFARNVSIALMPSYNLYHCVHKYIRVHTFHIYLNILLDNFVTFTAQFQSPRTLENGLVVEHIMYVRSNDAGCTLVDTYSSVK